jgi:hypothetical protein
MIIYILILFIIYITLNGYLNNNNTNERYSVAEIALGKKYLKSKKVAFCGLIRDREDTIPHLISKVEDVGKYFKDWEVLIVENDSKDNTRSMLLDWSNKSKKVSVLGCGGINLPECKLNMKPTTEHDISDYRITKMATLRNIYLDELKKRDDIDLVIVWDFDLVSEIDETGLFKTGHKLLMNNEINAICSNGIIKNDPLSLIPGKKLKKKLGILSYYYYDTYAYREFDDEITPIKDKQYYDEFYRKDPSEWSNNKDIELKKVRSCFGGFTIYKKEALLNSRYGTYKDVNNKPICEHEFLNEKIDGVYHSNELVHLIYEN